MNYLMLLPGLAGTAGGCALLYLASPNQRLLGRALPVLAGCLAAGVLLVVGIVALLGTLRPVGAAFTFVITVMLALVVLPYLGAWASLRRGR